MRVWGRAYPAAGLRGRVCGEGALGDGAQNCCGTVFGRIFAAVGTVAVAERLVGWLLLGGRAAKAPKIDKTPLASAAQFLWRC